MKKFIEKYIIFINYLYIRRGGSESVRKKWAFIIILLTGIVLGGLIGKLAQGIPSLWWLNYGNEFGFTKPLSLNLNVIKIEFGFTIAITVSSIIGMIIAILVYSWMSKKY